MWSVLLTSRSSILTILPDWSDAVSDWKQKKQKRSKAVSLQCYKGLAEVAIKCICDLLVALPHFNFHNNIIVMVVPLMNDPVRTVGLLAVFDKTQHLEVCMWVVMMWCCDFVFRYLRCVVKQSGHCWNRIKLVRPH